MKLEAILLAAGAGTRFGGGKLLAPWRGGIVLDGALTAAFASPTRAVYVVWGADPGVPEAAEQYAVRRDCVERLRLVEAPEHVMGLSRSLAAGVAALPEDSDGVFIFLGDMPRVPVGVCAPMVAALNAGAQASAATFDGKQGHPVMFARSLWPRLLSLGGDRGAGALLRELGDAVVKIDAPDDGVHFDVDRPGNLR